MPLYEYRCKACGHRFEKIQTFSAPDEKECPVCKGEVERLISAPAVHFSGSGFYSTDYKASPVPPRPSGDSSSKDGSSSKSEGGKDSSSSASSSDGGSKSSSSDSSPSAPAASSTPATPSGPSKS
jgi:putative FmdB family regulatory protein